MIEPDEKPVRKPRKGGTNAGNANLRSSTISSVGKALPNFPTSPEELAAQWEVGMEDTYSLMVKVTMAEGSTVKLLADVPLRSYSAGDLAGRFGPGLYYLRASPGKYAKKACKMIFSEEYSRENGFGTIQPEPMTARDRQAIETLQRATEGPTRPQDLAAAIEQFMDRRDQERGRMNAVPTAPAPDPLAAMQSQFTQLQTMMSFMESMEQRAIKTVEMRMGIKQPQETEMETSGSMMEKLLLKGLDIASAIMSRPQPVIPRQSDPMPVPVPQPQPEVPTREESSMPKLTPEEQNAIGGAVQMLRPYSGTLMELIAQGLTDEQIVAELDPWIPAPMAGPLANLASVVSTHGPSVLAAIHPGLVSDRWSSILPKLVEALQ